jgi:hypothetical protein
VDKPEKGAAVAALKEHLAATGGRSPIPAKMTLQQAYDFSKIACTVSALPKKTARMRTLQGMPAHKHCSRKELTLSRSIAENLRHGRIEAISPITAGSNLR